MPAQAGLLFQPTTPGLVRCNDFKDATKSAAELHPRAARQGALHVGTTYRRHRSDCQGDRIDPTDCLPDQGDPAGAEAALGCVGL